jgi:hypothetical protein
VNRSPPYCKPWRSNINPTAVGNFQLRSGHPRFSESRVKRTFSQFVVQNRFSSIRDARGEPLCRYCKSSRSLNLLNMCNLREPQRTYIAFNSITPKIGLLCPPLLVAKISTDMVKVILTRILA